MGLGNVFGGSFGQALNLLLPAVGTAFGAAFGAPQVGAAVGGLASTLLTGGTEAMMPMGGGAMAPNVPLGPPTYTQSGFISPDVWVEAGDPIQAFTGVPQLLPGGMERFPQVIPAMAAVPAVAGGAVAIAGMTARLGTAILRVAARMGVSLVSFAGLSRFAGRLWRSITSFSRRHPNISAVGLLTSLGFAAEEASEFLAWGTTRRRRRRGGISGRDIRITRRTLRRLASVRAAVGGGFARGRRRSARGDGVVVARAG